MRFRWSAGVPSPEAAGSVRDLLRRSTASVGSHRTGMRGAVNTRGFTVESPSGKWAVIDEQGWCRAMRVVRRWRPSSENPRTGTRTLGDDLVVAGQRLSGAVLARGTGPVAPIFDSGDLDHEMHRGPWVVVDSVPYDEFLACCQQLLDQRTDS